MNDFKTIACIMGAIRASEEKGVLDLSLFSPESLKTTERNRDVLAIKLQDAGYISGLKLSGDVYPQVEWYDSVPSVSLKGLDYIAENSHVQDAIKEQLYTAPVMISKALFGMRA